MQMVTFITASGKTIKHMAMVFTIILMVLSTKVIGLRISNTVKEKRFGQTMRATKVSTKKAKSTALASSTGLTGQLTQVNSSTIILRVKVSTLGLMDVNTMENGATTRCMAAVSLPGTTVVVMKVTISTIRKKARVFSHGPMVENTMASGKTASSTEPASTILARVTLKRASGAKANVFNG
jgi:hypothetical protein